MSAGDIKKYAIAREFRCGCAYCISGGGYEPSMSEHWKEGWNWGYTHLKQQLNEGTQQYIVKLGFLPFSQLEAMRAK